MIENKKLGFHFNCLLKILAGPHSGKEYSFQQSPILVGRGTENHIVLGNDKKISRLHLEIRVEPEGVYLRNLSKTNQTLLNGEEVVSQLIPPRCSIKLGETELAIEVQTNFQTSKGLSIAREPLFEKSFADAIESSPEPTPLKSIMQNKISEFKNVENNNSPNDKLSIEAKHKATSFPDNRRSEKPAIQSSFDKKKKFRSQAQSRSSGPSNPNQKASINFYLILVAVLGLGYLLFFGNKEKAAKLDSNKPRLTTDIDIEFRSYDELMKEFDLRRAKIGTRNFQMAQENFVRGFRDYRQGQYARAKESFQVVINLDSENEMARRYFQLAKLKFDEMVKFHMLQGKRYHDKKNWRLCKNGYFNAMTMLQNNQSDALFIEAERYYKFCSSALEGRF